MLCIFLIILASGGANSSTYSGYACEAFPGCHKDSLLSFSITHTLTGGSVASVPKQLEGQFLPFFQNEWIHMIHRTIAIGGGFILIILSFIELRQSQDRGNRIAGYAMIGLIFLEMGVGIVNAIYTVPLPISTLHTAIAATLIGFLSYTFAKGLHES